MNNLEQFMSHTSVRSFKEEALSEELKGQLVQAAQSGSSSNFVQAYSIIEVKDAQKRQEIGQLSNGESYITKSGVFYVFVADLYRNYQISKDVNEDLSSFASMESLIVSIVDTTIAAQSMSLYAESQGLGICYIGGVRNDLNRVAELLELPPYTVPLFGLTIGYPEVKNEVKPRLFADEILKVDSYQVDTQKIQAYDEVMADYFGTRSTNQQASDWTNKIQAHFAFTRRPEVLPFLKKQGFTFE